MKAVHSRAGSNPAVNKAAIESPVTEPSVIMTKLGGIVSDIAEVQHTSAKRSPGLDPRFFISGKSTGATAAISAALEPEIPETKNIAPINTYDSPPQTCPRSTAKNSIQG